MKMSIKNKTLSNSKITDSSREKINLSTTRAYPVNSKTEPQVTQKISMERWIESLTDCAD